MSNRAYHPESKANDRPSSSTTRRAFLRGATALAAGIVASPPTGAQQTAPLPKIKLGPHEVTRMITGGNPQYGFSHFNRLLDDMMREYFTDQRVVQFMLDCEKAGINTWQSSLTANAERQYPLIRDAGCKLNWIFLAGPWDIDRSAQTQEAFDAAMAKCVEISRQTKPVAVAHHGVYTDRLWRAGKLEKVREFVNRLHDAGFVAGISTHNPRVVEEIESKGWPTDFYMTCFYCISREPEEFVKEIGIEPVGETYLSTDPERMCKVVRQTSKTCLAFKILAAGRKCDSPQQVRSAFEFAFQNIKPTDGVIVGMFPKFSDQVSENVKFVKELAV
ncbi:MAG: hypothetical protein ACE145_02460 [Terriglobia bacterium]